MGKHSRTIKTLREIALEYGVGEQPDLAAMARALGSVIHKDTPVPGDGLSKLHHAKRGFQRWLLGERNKPAISVLIMSWPPNYYTPVHDHGGLWGVEVALYGALEVESYERESTSNALRFLRRDWLGPGDGTWFEAGETHAHRCRNLSRHDTALTLHVYGGQLGQYSAYEPAAHKQNEQANEWHAQTQHAAIAGRLRG